MTVRLHPSAHVPGAGLLHVVVNQQDSDPRILWTGCGVRAALTELAPAGDRSPRCRECFR